MSLDTFEEGLGAILAALATGVPLAIAAVRQLAKSAATVAGSLDRIADTLDRIAPEVRAVRRDVAGLRRELRERDGDDTDPDIGRSAVEEGPELVPERPGVWRWRGGTARPTGRP